MKGLWCILLVIFFGSCQNKKTDKTDRAKNKLTDLEKEIARAFSDVDSLLSIDNGVFWNEKLNGPIILVDPGTRVFYSNENNSTKDFKPIGKIYTDSLPPEINSANTAIDWGGKRWAMVVLPLPAEKIARNNLLIHELFHRLQPSIGYHDLQESNNGHLDTYDGRLLLRLELQALEKALNDNDGAARSNHIKNALTFRQKRHRTPEIKDAENSLEQNEGLAEYTAIMLSGRNADELKTHLVQSKTDFYSYPSFVRSFAYQTIPIYGYLLSLNKPNWHKEVDRNTNLTEYFIKTFAIALNEDLAIEQVAEQNDYGYGQIVMEETAREKKRREKLAKLRIKFNEKPTLELPFENMNISFDPGNLTPLENLGTVYPTLRVTDNWGILTVENGALLASDWSKVTVSAPDRLSDKMAKGDGWQLELNTGWKVEKTDKAFRLVKK